MILNNEQNNGLNLMKLGYNMFITGKAGTGKSTLINEFINWLKIEDKEYMITAPTGIAALNIDGVTVHRAFKAPATPLVGELKGIPSTFKDVDVIIIDEIGMVRRDLFDRIGKIILHTNKYRRSRGLNDVQLIVCGDFLQLAPVITSSDRKILEEYYGEQIYNAYAFESQYWDIFNFKVLQLEDVMRQGDKDFIDALNKARFGNKNCLSYFQKHSCKEKLLKAITLCGLRKEVELINAKEYDKIETKERVYEAEITGEVKESDKPTSDILRLKEGVRIMTLINDYKGRYSNGSFGTVDHIGKDNISLIMDNGEYVELERYSWSVNDYILKDGKLELEAIGTFTQFPLKLAYAITIHKSQGQTYSEVNLSPYSWDYGQLYVALSRVKSIDKLHLLSEIKSEYLKSSQEVKNFYSRIGVELA